MMSPQGFEAYARIFFPFDGENLSWTEVARRNGRTAHALMERETIAGDDDAALHDRAHRLSGEQFQALLAVLSGHTSSAGAWFLAWNGYADVTLPAPLVSHTWRDMYLLHGSLGGYADFCDPPSYWWPEDRAWCLSTDVDFEWCYLAATAACVRDVLAVPVIDAYATLPANPARSGMDVINDPDGAIRRWA
jgi:hypothetical protein